MLIRSSKKNWAYKLVEQHTHVTIEMMTFFRRSPIRLCHKRVSSVLSSAKKVSLLFDTNIWEVMSVVSRVKGEPKKNRQTLSKNSSSFLVWWPPFSYPSKQWTFLVVQVTRRPFPLVWNMPTVKYVYGATLLIWLPIGFCFCFCYCML